MARHFLLRLRGRRQARALHALDAHSSSPARSWPALASRAFLGAFRTVSAIAAPDKRAGLIAAVYIVSYLAFSLPAVAAGIAVRLFGLPTTSVVYGGGIAALAAAAGLATLAQPAATERGRSAPMTLRARARCHPPPAERRTAPRDQRRGSPRAA